MVEEPPLNDFPRQVSVRPVNLSMQKIQTNKKQQQLNDQLSAWQCTILQGGLNIYI